MIKRLEWFIATPEAMNAVQVEVNLLRMAWRLEKMSRTHVESKIKTARQWLKWYNDTDFAGRYPTNQVSFVRRVLPMLENKLKSMGSKRQYTKHQNNDKTKSKRQRCSDRNQVGRIEL
jgi:hypothetical protein